MIITLAGSITEKLGDSLVVEAGGIGYEVVVTVETWGAARPGQESKYYIYEHIREDAHQLYGFTDLAGRQLFIQLIGVNGVGPKSAMQILSAGGTSRLQQAIESGDPGLLKGITGVGPKTAQRIVLDLRGKLELGPGGLAPVADSAYQALVGLGYTPAQATQAVAAIPEGLTSDQDRIKAALKYIK
jgi:Holliday junction DNA helicase RuvA